MNKYLKIVLLLLFSVKSYNQEKVDIKNMIDSYKTKDEKKILDYFPQDFISFKSIFGWNDSVDKPNVLYDDSKVYIDYLFQIARKNEFARKKILKIAKDAHWEADGVSYFQIDLNELVESNTTDILSMIYQLPRNEFVGFWNFYFESEDLRFSKKLFDLLDEKNRIEVMKIFEKLIYKEQSWKKKDKLPYTYVIKDKDGYVNLREQPNSKSKIIEKLLVDDEVITLDRSGDWWFLISKNKNIGFVHNSRLFLK
ncbi:SH3 domain-containing protein [Flavobacterium oreochromis]|uniref:SH3 domain-containing protein n=1 Tax=Flavobacterium oreochromis TaxID=2906078 RepID=UPI00385D66AB